MPLTNRKSRTKHRRKPTKSEAARRRAKLAASRQAASDEARLETAFARAADRSSHRSEPGFR